MTFDVNFKKVYFEIYRFFPLVTFFFWLLFTPFQCIIHIMGIGGKVQTKPCDAFLLPAVYIGRTRGSSEKLLNVYLSFINCFLSSPSLSSYYLSAVVLLSLFLSISLLLLTSSDAFLPTGVKRVHQRLVKKTFKRIPFILKLFSIFNFISDEY